MAEASNTSGPKQMGGRRRRSTRGRKHRKSHRKSHRKTRRQQKQKQQH